MSSQPAALESSATRLRPATIDDVGWMSEMMCSPELSGEHNWGGAPRDRADVERDLREQLRSGGLLGSTSGTLIVELGDGTPIGDVSWRTERWGPSRRSSCPAIGVTLLPPFRGRGHGSAAQALLVDHLFTADPALHRVQSDTAVDNIAEQRALTKIGMVVEGTVRDAEFRNGRFHDHVLYSVLRSEWESRRSG